MLKVTQGNSNRDFKQVIVMLFWTQVRLTCFKLQWFGCEDGSPTTRVPKRFQLAAPGLHKSMKISTDDLSSLKHIRVKHEGKPADVSDSSRNIGIFHKLKVKLKELTRVETCLKVLQGTLVLASRSLAVVVLVYVFIILFLFATSCLIYWLLVNM